MGGQEKGSLLWFVEEIFHLFEKELEEEYQEIPTPLAWPSWPVRRRIERLVQIPNLPQLPIVARPEEPRY